MDSKLTTSSSNSLASVNFSPSWSINFFNWSSLTSGTLLCNLELVVIHLARCWCMILLLIELSTKEKSCNLFCRSPTLNVFLDSRQMFTMFTICRKHMFLAILLVCIKPMWLFRNIIVSSNGERPCELLIPESVSCPSSSSIGFNIFPSVTKQGFDVPSTVFFQNFDSLLWPLLIKIQISLNGHNVYILNCSHLIIRCLTYTTDFLSGAVVLSSSFFFLRSGIKLWLLWSVI